MSESDPLAGSILVVLLNLASLWSEAFAVLNLVHEVETAETWCSESANRWRRAPESYQCVVVTPVNPASTWGGRLQAAVWWSRSF